MSQGQGPSVDSSQIKPKRSKWIILGLLTAGMFAANGLQNLWGPIMPAFMADLGVTRSQAGLILTVMSLSQIILMIPWGAAADRGGVQKYFGYTAIASGLAVASVGFAREYLLISALILVSGLVFSSQAIFRQKATIEWFSRKERATASGVINICLALGPFVYTPLLTYLVAQLGLHWSIAFYIVGALIVLTGAVTVLIYRDPPGSSGGQSQPQSMVEKIKEFGTLARNRNVMLSNLGFGASMGVMQMATSWGVTFLRQELGFEVMVSAAIMMIWSLAGMFRPLGGLISDRLLKGKRKMICAPMALSEAILCILLTQLPLKGSLLLTSVIFFLLSLSRAMWGPSGSIWGIELTPRHLLGSSAALGGLIMGVSNAVFPLITGWIVDTTGSFTYGWLAVALLELFVTVPAWSLVKD